MTSQIREQIKSATQKAITDMEPYKAKAADRYEYLVSVTSEISETAIKKLDTMTDTGLKAAGINNAKAYINYFTHSQEAARFGNLTKQIGALIEKNL